MHNRLKQRGNIIVYAILALAILAALITLYGMYKSELTRADKAGYDRALKEVAQRDKKELEDAQTLIASLTLEKDTQAALHAEEQARLKRIHDKEVADAKVKTADLLARINRGSLVLRDPGDRAGGPFNLNQVSNSGRSQGSATATIADGSGQTISQGLSRAASEFLLREATLADEVTLELELCWGIARDDRAKSGTSQ